MSDINDQILSIEKEIRETPYHKGTEHHIGILRARLSKLKEKDFEHQSKKGGGHKSYAVKKQGDATVVLVGPPSSGKSTLINRLTNAQSKVAPYAFTTVSVIPGMMEYNHARIQILDVPGLIEGAEEGKGRGREVLSVVRGADLIILLTDIQRKSALENIEKALERNGIRLNKEKPKIIINKKVSGGLIIHTNIKQSFGIETIKSVAMEMGIKNAEITINEKVEFERLVDGFSKSRVYLKYFKVVNKSDLIDETPDQEDCLYISAEKNQGIDSLKEKIYKTIGFIKIYLLKEDEEPGKNNPMIIKELNSLKEIAEQIGEEFASTKSQAKIWGNGAKYPGQEVSIETIAQDGMIVRFI